MKEFQLNTIEEAVEEMLSPLKIQCDIFLLS